VSIIIIRYVRVDSKSLNRQEPIIIIKKLYPFQNERNFHRLALAAKNRGDVY